MTTMRGLTRPGAIPGYVELGGHATPREGDTPRRTGLPEFVTSPPLKAAGGFVSTIVHHAQPSVQTAPFALGFAQS